jgi:hypothetical protein
MALTKRLSVEAQAQARETFDHRWPLFVNRVGRGVDLEAMSDERKDSGCAQLEEASTQEVLAEPELARGCPPKAITWSFGLWRVDDRM